MERLSEPAPPVAGTDGYVAAELEAYVRAAMGRRDELRTAIEATRRQARLCEEMLGSPGTLHEEIGRSWLAIQQEADAIRAHGDAEAERLLREAEQTATQIISSAVGAAARGDATPLA